jgi:hypothetical protein
MRGGRSTWRRTRRCAVRITSAAPFSPHSPLPLSPHCPMQDRSGPMHPRGPLPHRAPKRALAAQTRASPGRPTGKRVIHDTKTAWSRLSTRLCRAPLAETAAARATEDHGRRHNPTTHGAHAQPTGCPTRATGKVRYLDSLPNYLPACTPGLLAAPRKCQPHVLPFASSRLCLTCQSTRSTHPQPPSSSPFSPCPPAASPRPACHWWPPPPRRPPCPPPRPPPPPCPAPPRPPPPPTPLPEPPRPCQPPPCRWAPAGPGPRLRPRPTPPLQPRQPAWRTRPFPRARPPCCARRQRTAPPAAGRGTGPHVSTPPPYLGGSRTAYPHKARPSPPAHLHIRHAVRAQPLRGGRGGGRCARAAQRLRGGAQHLAHAGLLGRQAHDELRHHARAAGRGRGGAVGAADAGDRRTAQRARLRLRLAGLASKGGCRHGSPAARHARGRGLPCERRLLLLLLLRRRAARHHTGHHRSGQGARRPARLALVRIAGHGGTGGQHGGGGHGGRCLRCSHHAPCSGGHGAHDRPLHHSCRRLADHGRH